MVIEKICEKTKYTVGLILESEKYERTLPKGLSRQLIRKLHDIKNCSFLVLGGTNRIAQGPRAYWMPFPNEDGLKKIDLFVSVDCDQLKRISGMDENKSIIGVFGPSVNWTTTWYFSSDFCSKMPCWTTCERKGISPPCMKKIKIQQIVEVVRKMLESDGEYERQLRREGCLQKEGKQEIETINIQREKNGLPTVLIARRYFYPDLHGGGEISYREFAREMDISGFNVHVATVKPRGDTEGMTVKRERNWTKWIIPRRDVRSSLSEIAERIEPDLVITDVDSERMFVKHIDVFECKKMLYEQFWRLSVGEEYDWNGELVGRMTSRNKELVRKVDKVVLNSQYHKALFESVHDKSAEYVNPPIEDAFLWKDNGAREYISMVTATESKGGKMFSEIANSMSDRKFMVMGDSEFQMPSNVKITGYCNTYEYYPQSKIVLVPSVVHETFSRVAVEAMKHGCPVIVSNRGALPETIGTGGMIAKYNDLTEWKEKIEEILGNWREWNRRALERGKKFSLRKERRKYVDVVRRLV